MRDLLSHHFTLRIDSENAGHRNADGDVRVLILGKQESRDRCTGQQSGSHGIFSVVQEQVIFVSGEIDGYLREYVLVRGRAREMRVTW